MQQRFLLQILLPVQHVSGTTMPIIRSSRVLYSNFEVRHARCVEPKLQNGKNTVKTQLYLIMDKTPTHALFYSTLY